MIKFDKVSKKYFNDSFILQNINLKIDKGEFVFLVGPTGSGKTTLLRLLIKDLTPSQGAVSVADWDLVTLPKEKIPELRRKIGFIFQDLKLLMDKNLFENVSLSLEIAGLESQKIKKRVEEILEMVGLAKHHRKFPLELSGGELQRAAIARAISTEPEILLADEPTGNLDLATSWEIIKLLQDLNKKGTTIIMATHNNDLVNSLKKRVVELSKGRIIRDEKEGKYGSD